MPTYKATDIAKWCGGTWTCEPPRFSGFCFDTRKLQEGELFVALEGEHADGQSYVREAFSKGAAGAVVGASFDGGQDVAQPLLRVENTRRALQDMAHAYRQRLESTFVGVTGSVGKTSVKEMCADALAAQGAVARTRGNWNNDLGLPLCLLSMAGNEAYGVFEMGISHQGEMQLLCDILEPSCGVMTKIGPAHVEHFPGTEAIAREKAVLFSSLPSDGFAVMNRDDAWFELVASEAPCEVVTISITQDADFTATEHDNGWILTDKAVHEAAEFKAPLPGPYMVENALLASAVARRQGVAWSSIIASLEAYKPLPMRWQEVDVRGVHFINDAYNANPMSVRAAVRALRDMAVKGRKWLVLGDMRELGDTAVAEHELLGREVAAGEWAGLIVLGDLGQHIADGAIQAGMSPATVAAAATHEEAAHLLMDSVKAGDAVLLKASRGMTLERVLDSFQQSTMA